MANENKILLNGWLAGQVTPGFCSTGNSPDFLNTQTNQLFACINDTYQLLGTVGVFTQTPWVSNIDGGGFTLTNVSGITVNGNINVTGSYLVNGVPIASALQTPWLQNINGAGFNLSNVNVITANEVILSTPPGTGAFLRYESGVFQRWTVSKSPEAETGGNAGSNYQVNRYSDTGTFLGTPFMINRATGLISGSNGLNIAGDINVTGGSIIVNGVPVNPAVAQSPWTQNINGAGFSLSNAGVVSANSVRGIGAFSSAAAGINRVEIGVTGGGDPTITIESSGSAPWNIVNAGNLFWFLGTAPQMVLATSGNNAALQLAKSNTSIGVQLNTNGNSFFNGGSLGIGIPAPAFPLDVVGDINVNGGGYRINGVLITLGGTVTSVFGRSNAVVAVAGDYTAAQVTNAVDQTVVYNNPSWIGSLSWTKVAGAPNFIIDPTTTVGDLIVRGVSGITRQGVGTDGSVLSADSTQSTGLKWIVVGGGGGATQTPWLQDIDGAAFTLNNVSAVGIGTFAAPSIAYLFLVAATTSSKASIELIDPSSVFGAWINIDGSYKIGTSGSAGLPGTPNTDYISTNRGWHVVVDLGGPLKHSIVVAISGNVGILKTNPTFALDVTGDVNCTGVFRVNGVPISTGGGGAPQTPWASNINGANFSLVSVGSIGIGVATPFTTLHVRKGASGVPGIVTANTVGFFENSTDNAYIELYSGLGNPSSAALILGSNGAANSSQFMDAFDGTNHNTLVRANLAGSYVTISTVATERMRITATGNIGIGNPLTTLPVPDTATHLVVGGVSTTAVGEVTMATNASSSQVVGRLNFVNYAISVADKRIALIISSTEGTIDSGYLGFYTWNAGVAAERMHITPTGNVGIGIPNPQVSLDCGGAGNFRTAITLITPAKTGNTLGTIGITSVDATAPLQGSITLLGSGSASPRLSIQCVEQTVAFRNITLCEGGGFVGIGTAIPASAISFGSAGTDAQHTIALFENAGGGNIFGMKFTFTGANRTAFLANGVEVMAVATNGVAINGTSVEAGHLLEVWTAQTNAQATVYIRRTAATVVAAIGFSGVVTANPTIYVNANSDDLCFGTENGSGVTLEMARFNTGTNSFSIGRAGPSPAGERLNVTINSPKSTGATTAIPTAYFLTNDATGPFGLQIRVICSPFIGNRAAMMQTGDVNVSDSGFLQLQPTSGTNVLIGGGIAQTPQAKLDVIGGAVPLSLRATATGPQLLTAISASTNNMQWGNSNAPTAGAAIGMSSPAQGLTTNLILSMFNGASWLDVMTFTPGGGCGLGLPNPTLQLQLAADSAGKPSTNTWNVISDIRTKQNIRPLVGGLPIINEIVPMEAEYNGLADTPIGKRVVSVIVEDLMKILPGCVPFSKGKLHPNDVDDSTILHFNSHEILFHLILAVQQLAELKADKP